LLGKRGQITEVQSLLEVFSGVTRVNVLGVGVSPLNMDEAVKALINFRRKGRSGYVCVTGVHGVIESQRDLELKRIHNRSLLTVPDGMPTVWVGKEQGFVHMGRVYGPDLMLRVMKATSSIERSLLVSGEESLRTQSFSSSGSDKRYFSHFLYGSTDEMLKKLKENLEARFPGIQIVGTYAPPFRPLNNSEEEELREIVMECKPDFFWVGLSTPKQEKFMASHSSAENGCFENQNSEIKESRAGCESLNHKSAEHGMKLDCGIMLGVGAAFPIHAGEQKDAPEWIKNSGLQWFYRLCQDPKRLWRRYFDIVPSFLWLTIFQLLGIRKYNLEGERPPISRS